MSIEEKARAYDEALKEIKELIALLKKNDVITDDGIIESSLQRIFPELAESEGENLKNKSGYYKAGKFWKASTLWNAVKGKSPQRVPNRYILQECTWDISSLQHFADEVKNVQEVDLNYPIILDMNGNILDGAHRVVKAYLEGKDVDIVYLGDDEWPEPDYDEEKAVRESEDERIRKELIEFIKSLLCNNAFDRYKLGCWIAWLEKQKENPKSTDSIPSNCTSDAKCEDRWHKVEDSLPNNTREVLCKDAIGNYFIGRYYSKGIWEISMYDDCDKSNEDNPPVAMWIDIPSEKQKEQKPEEPNWIHHKADLSDCSEEYIKAYYDGWNNCNQQHAQLEAERKPAEKPNLVAKLRHHLATTPKEQLEKEWDDLKEWCNVGPTVQEFLYGKPAEWSEEDEKYRNALINICLRPHDEIDDRPWYKWANWLKSLPERFNLQPKNEWNEEDFEKLVGELVQDIVANESDAKNYGTEKKPTSFFLTKYSEKFKSIRPHWKPSEEQMEALKCAIEDIAKFSKRGGRQVEFENEPYYMALHSLYEQLKNL